MEKQYDLVALGEYLIDFTPAGAGDSGNPRYEMNPGGAPTNCLAACAGLGGRTGLIAAVGDDLFGRFLREKLRQSGVDDAGVITVPEATTLAFVSLGVGGEREFAFMRDPGADTRISPEAVDASLLASARYFHFGSLSLTHEPAKSATEFAVKYAREHGALISYDPNYRAPLWRDSSTAVERMLWGIAQADLVKLSEEELQLLTGGDADAVLGMGVKELYVTAGHKGAYYYTPRERGFVPGFRVNAVDTTGCGDAFTGAVIYQNCRCPQRSIEERTLVANAVGALCATKKGGMCAMPKPQEVAALLSGRSL